MLRRVVAMWRARRAQADLAEEMETHRRLIEQRLRESGSGATDAASESRRRMGNVTLAREEARWVSTSRWLESVAQDVVYAFRLLRRAPGFSAAMMLVMSVGIGAATAIFGLIDGLVLRSLPVHEPERLVYFSTPSFSYPIFQEVRQRGGGVFSSVVAWDMDRLNVAWHTELEPTEVLMASDQFYSTLGINASIGRLFGPEDDRIGGGASGLVAAISHAAWQRRFNSDPSVVGRTIRVEAHTFTIIGVTPPGFFGVAPGLGPELTIPLTTLASPERLRSGTSSWVHLLARLHDGVTLPQANGALSTFWPAVLQAATDQGMPPERRAMFLGRPTTLESAHAGYSRVRNQFRDPLVLLMGLVSLLLAVACASAANLLLARGVARHREVAVRLAVGASRGRLIRQMLTEAFIWTLLASAAGLLLAYWGAGVLVSRMTTSQETIVLDLAMSGRMLAFCVGLTLVTSAVAALIPALRATALDPNRSLKETGQTDTAIAGRWSFGRMLIAAQIALTVMLVFGAALFTRSLASVLTQDAGLDRSGVLVLATDAEAAGYEDERLALFYEQLLARLSSIPGVQSASLSMYPPISDEDGAWTQSIAVDGAPVPAQPAAEAVYFNTVSAGYFRTVGMQMLRGRDFMPSDDGGAARVVVINETLARRFFQNEDPLGRSITIGRNAGRRDLTIVGLVSDAKYQRLQETPRSIAYLPWRQERAENLFAEVRTAGPAGSIAESIRREVRRLDPVVPIRLETVSDRIRESLVTERMMVLLASALAIAAVILACAALYGLLAYAVSRRTREIGVRLALGASRLTVLRSIVTESLTLAMLGTAAGVVASLWLGRLAATVLFQVGPRDPLSLVAAGGIMLSVAALAAFLPARRASRVDPVVALKCE